MDATFPQREGGRLGSRQGGTAQEQERLAVVEEFARVTRAADLHALCLDRRVVWEKSYCCCAVSWRTCFVVVVAGRGAFAVRRGTHALVLLRTPRCPVCSDQAPQDEWMKKGLTCSPGAPANPRY